MAVFGEGNMINYPVGGGVLNWVGMLGMDFENSRKIA